MENSTHRDQAKEERKRTQNMVELDIRINAGDLYDYLLAHTYASPSGLIGAVCGALLVVIAFMRGQWAFLVAGAIILAYLPVTLFLRSRQQALNPQFKKPLHYRLDDEGITVSQGEAAQSQEWDKMVKAVSTPRSIIIYTSRVNATIFPRRELGDRQAALIEVISTHMPPKKVKIRS